jgi:hypothetical protein
MREYIRHPSDIPIKYHIEGSEPQHIEHLNNISTGGLSFRSLVYIKENTPILINIPIIKPGLRVRGVVVWCRPRSGAYDIGVKFLDKETEFRVRLIEQICYIEHYRKEVLISEGRKLTSEQAAIEWIEKFAQDFPSE